MLPLRAVEFPRDGLLSLNNLNELMEGNNKDKRPGSVEGVVTRRMWPKMKPFYLGGNSVVRDRESSSSTFQDGINQ